MSLLGDILNQIVYTPIPAEKLDWGELMFEAFGALALAVGLYLWSDYLYGIHDYVNLTFARFVRFHMYLVAIRVPYEFYRLLAKVVYVIQQKNDKNKELENHVNHKEKL